MTNIPFLRKISEDLNPHWENHPSQRDFVHGLFHHFMGEVWKEMGCDEEAEKDYKRRDDHWIRHENLREYQKRTGRKKSP